MWKHDQIRRTVLKGLCALVVIFCAEQARAAPLEVQLLTSPLNVSTLRIGEQPESVKIIARVNREGAQFEWTLEGPGALEEATPPRKATYRPPARLETETAEATVRVTVRDERGATTEQHLTLTLHAAAPAAPPSPLPPSQDVQQLLQQADVFFQKTFYTEPQGNNAFALYQEVLQHDPANQQARQRIQQMAADYRQWGDIARDKQEAQNARKYYRRYLKLARYLSDTLGDKRIRPELEEVQRWLQEGGQPANMPTPPPSPTPRVILTPTPAPTPSPLPTATPPLPTPTPVPTPPALPTATPALPLPTPTAAPTNPPTAEPTTPATLEFKSLTEQLQELKRSLAQKLERYTALVAREQEGDNVQEQMLPLLQDIIVILEDLEFFYEHSDAPDMQERIQAVQEAREKFEVELLERTE